MLLKQCPYCKEYIHTDATKCKYCGSQQPEKFPEFHEWLNDPKYWKKK